MPDASGVHPRTDLRHVPVDRAEAQSHRNRHPVVPVADEVQVADPVQLGRGNELAAPLGQCQLYPPLPVDACSGMKPAVKVACTVNTADDCGQRDDLQAEGAFGGPSQRGDHVVEEQKLGEIARLPLQLDGHLTQQLAASGALEVVLGVSPVIPGVDHGYNSSTRWPTTLTTAVVPS